MGPSRHDDAAVARRQETSGMPPESPRSERVGRASPTMTVSSNASACINMVSMPRLPGPGARIATSPTTMRVSRVMP
jgi:hypothetical protein